MNEQALPPAVGYGVKHHLLLRDGSLEAEPAGVTVDYGLRFEHYGEAYPDTPYGMAIFDYQKYQNGVENSGITWHSLTPSVPLSGVSGQPVLLSPRFGSFH